MFLVATHGNVHIFKNMSWCDTTAAVGRFDEVVAGSAFVFVAQNVHDGKWLGELPGLDQKACAIDRPVVLHVHSFTLWGREKSLLLLCRLVDSLLASSVGGIYAQERARSIPEDWCSEKKIKVGVELMTGGKSRVGAGFRGSLRDQRE